MRSDCERDLKIECLATRYNPVPATSFFRGFPRFGHSDKFADIITSKEERQDYIAGLLFAGLFVLVIMFVWTVALLVLKCIGKRVGFLSGSAFEKREGKCSKPFVCRIIFMLASMLFVAFSVVSVENGITKLFYTANTVVQGASMANNLVGDVQTEINKFNGHVDVVTSSHEQLKEYIAQNQCFSETPSLPDNVSREELAQLTEKINNSTKQIGNAISDATTNSIDNDMIAELLSFLKKAASNFVKDGKPFWNRFLQMSDPIEVKEPEDISTSATSKETSAENSAETLTRTSWLSMIIYIPFVFTGFMFIIFDALAMCGIFNRAISCLTNWLFLPLLAIEMIFAYVLSSLLLLGGGANADFCSGGANGTPDNTTLTIINHFVQNSDVGEKKIEFVTDAARRYVSECQSGNPFEDLYGQYLEAKEAIQLSRELIGNITVPISIQEFCDTPSLFDTLNRGLGSVDILLKYLGGTLSLFRCQNVSPIYQHPVYEGTCKYSVQGLTWAFASFLVVAVMGHIMFMVRSSLQPESEDIASSKKLEQAPNDEENDVEAVDKGDAEDEIVVSAAAATATEEGYVDEAEDVEVAHTPLQEDGEDAKESNDSNLEVATSPEDGPDFDESKDRVEAEDIAAPSMDEGAQDAEHGKAFDELVSDRFK
eukprot:CAMPEP_0194218518 /NCGR_PEP_ID=MMETSP0156-20130528/23952_1 /TAXON_ID=33649 /ORGANISM="Thalassionema nitzschioides, Strain L26-B" /LENGTH=654 /DNA_ID=CAMNT_0038947905 /DNA_START=39 /DNA_END=2003 /DNA_ORIENTATION=-